MSRLIVLRGSLVAIIFAATGVWVCARQVTAAAPGTAPQAGAPSQATTAAGPQAADKTATAYAQTAEQARILRRFEAEAITNLRPVLQVEVAFMQRICGPSAEQLRQLKGDRKKQLQKIAEELRGGQFDFDDPWSKLRPVARRFVQRKVATWVHAHLSPAQAHRYESEIERREAKIRDVCAKNFVAAMDRDLLLSAEQREKLGAELARKWDSEWTMGVVNGLMQRPRVFPKLPDELVLPYLDASQQARWASLPKQDRASWGIQQDAFLGMWPELDDKD
jgi:hypothetical protein